MNHLNPSVKKSPPSITRLSSTQLTHLIDSLTETFFVLDHQLRFTYVNAKALDHLAATVPDLLGQPITDHWPEFTQTQLCRQCYQALQDHRPIVFEEFLLRHNRWFRFHLRPLRLGLAVNITDSTKYHHLEQVIDDKESEFIAIASHELKTPLTTIAAYLQLLDRMLDHHSEPRIKLLMNRTRHYIDHMSALITELVDVSEINTGSLQLNLASFDIEDLIHRCIETTQLTYPTHKIERQGRIHQLVYGDMYRLEQVLKNLLDNSIKYSPHADKVIVTVCKENGYIKITITDFGLGVPASLQSHLFSRFYRAEATAKQFSGFGTGLYFSWQVIHRHGGTIGFTSQERRGSSFYFTVPYQQSNQ